MLAKDEPDMLTGSPPCTMFSQMQSRNKNRMARDIWEYRSEEAKEMMEFAAKAYIDQVRRGKYFVHEHPRWAKSWSLPEMRRLMNMEGV